MKNLFDKFRVVERTISNERDNFTLFGLFLREDAQDKWDLIVSASWLTGDYFKNLEYITEKLKSQIEPNEMTGISRIILLSPSDKFVRNINSAINIEHGKVELEDCLFNDVFIKQAILITSKKMQTKLVWDDQWISKHKNLAMSGLNKLGQVGFMEIRLALMDSRFKATQAELLRQAEPAQIETFGWPIGIVIDREGDRPKPTNDGIVTEILIQDTEELNSYDYWTLRKDGAFYLLKSLFEDERRPGYIFFNTRIVRITETLLYAARLYSGLHVPRNQSFMIGIRHGGLKGRILSVSSLTRRFPPSETNISNVDEQYNEVETTIDEIESTLVDVVEKFTQPLFVVFSFFELSRAILEEIVNKYVTGEVT